MKLYRTRKGPVIEHGQNAFRSIEDDWDALLAHDDLLAYLRKAQAGGQALASLGPLDILAPISKQEVWAAGVTYYRSRDARMEESKSAGGGDFYDRVYHAERPELFFKATPNRVVGPGQPVAIRSDAVWSVPEPELTLVVTPTGKITGYTIGNDMSSRDIEGENPLYLPQAKVYDRSCGLGPCILVTSDPLPLSTEIHLEIKRAGRTEFEGSTTLEAIKRDLTSLVNFLYRDNSFPQQLAKFIQDEHPQTIALILSNLEASQAAVLLSSLPAETRAEVATRMGDLDQISPEVVRNIASVIGQKLRYLGELSRESVGGVRAVANMFNRLDRNTCSQMLEAVEKDNPALFENIRRFMFVFRDLEDLDAAAIRTLIGRVDRSTLLLAMKGADESLRRKFLSTQSQRGAEMTAEELANLGPVKLKDVDAAQQQTITVARELEKEGLISLSGSANEEYVY